MACCVIVEFAARPGEAALLVEALRKALPQTRSREGCEQLQLIVNPESPEEMMIFMLWRTRADYDTYRAWRSTIGDVDRFSAVTTSGLKTRFLDTVAI